MVLTQLFVSLSVFLAVVGAVPSSSNAAHVFQRSALLEGRQTCPAGYIPACPVGIPCVPPGSICCDDGITYVFPPNSCPEGTKPIATASNQGQEPTSTPESTIPPTSEPPASTVEPSTSAPPAPTAEPSTSAPPFSIAVPTTTASYVQPSTNITIPSTGGIPSPSYTQVPVSHAVSLQVGWAVGLFGIIAWAPVVLMN